MTAEQIEDLRGSLAFTTLTDVLQFLHTTGRTGELWVEGGPESHAAQVYFERGNVYHAQEGSSTGVDAMVEIISWVDGTFIFSADKMTPAVSIEMSLPNALVEAARRLDELRREQAEHSKQHAPQRLLSSFAESTGVIAVILMSRDGSPIALASPDEDLEMGALINGLTSLTATVDRLGESQGCRPFDGVFIEFDRFQVLCMSVASDVLAVVAPGRAQLGVIRHKAQQLADALTKALAD